MSELASVSVCNLPHPTKDGRCRQKFYGPQHLTIGAADGGRSSALLEKMTRHLIEHHREYFASIMVQGEQLKGLLLMQAFETTDPELRKQANYCRWSVHQQTLGARITDENLQDAATKMASQIVYVVLATTGEVSLDEITAGVCKVLLDELTVMRDALQEPVAPPNPAAPVVATQ